jgi:adenylylsulfate kinase
METNKRTIMKTVSWRIIATLTTMMLVYLFTGKITLAFGIGVLEAVIKMAAYFMHERMWLKLRLGVRDEAP